MVSYQLSLNYDHLEESRESAKKLKPLLFVWILAAILQIFCLCNFIILDNYNYSNPDSYSDNNYYFIIVFSCVFSLIINILHVPFLIYEIYYGNCILQNNNHFHDRTFFIFISFIIRISIHIFNLIILIEDSQKFTHDFYQITLISIFSEIVTNLLVILLYLIRTKKIFNDNNPYLLTNNMNSYIT